MTTNPQPYWTAERVRSELPDVRLRRPDGTLTVATVRRRLNRYASIHTDNGGRCEASWEAIARALEGCYPLDFGMGFGGRLG